MGHTGPSLLTVSNARRLTPSTATSHPRPQTAVPPRVVPPGEPHPAVTTRKTAPRHHPGPSHTPNQPIPRKTTVTALLSPQRHRSRRTRAPHSTREHENTTRTGRRPAIWAPQGAQEAARYGVPSSRVSGHASVTAPPEPGWSDPNCANWSAETHRPTSISLLPALAGEAGRVLGLGRVGVCANTSVATACRREE